MGVDDRRRTSDRSRAREPGDHGGLSRVEAPALDAYDLLAQDVGFAPASEMQAWDEHRALELIGTTAVVTMVYLDCEGEELGCQTFSGLVVSVDRRRGVELEIFQPHRGERTYLAPILDAFEPADPGFYDIDGLTVEDPDWFVDLSATIDRPGEQLDKLMVH